MSTWLTGRQGVTACDLARRLTVVSGSARCSRDPRWRPLGGLRRAPRAQLHAGRGRFAGRAHGRRGPGAGRHRPRTQLQQHPRRGPGPGRTRRGPGRRRPGPAPAHRLRPHHTRDLHGAGRTWSATRSGPSWWTSHARSAATRPARRPPSRGGCRRVSGSTRTSRRRVRPAEPHAEEALRLATLPLPERRGGALAHPAPVSSSRSSARRPETRHDQLPRTSGFRAALPQASGIPQRMTGQPFSRDDVRIRKPRTAAKSCMHMARP